MIKILKYGEVENNAIFARGNDELDVSASVSEIIKNVREKGDEALYMYAEKFDRVKLDSLIVTKEEIEAARAAVEPKFLEVLEKAAAISGAVRIDEDGDGEMDETARGLSGIRVDLLAVDGAHTAVVAQTTTDEAGAYQFVQLYPENKILRVAQLRLWKS